MDYKMCCGGLVTEIRTSWSGGC